MKIERLKTKIKISFEYPNIDDDGSYLSISRKDLDKLHLRVFLKDGINVFAKDIKQITLKLKEIKK